MKEGNWSECFCFWKDPWTFLILFTNVFEIDWNIKLSPAFLFSPRKPQHLTIFSYSDLKNNMLFGREERINSLFFKFKPPFSELEERSKPEKEQMDSRSHSQSALLLYECSPSDSLLVLSKQAGLCGKNIFAEAWRGGCCWHDNSWVNDSSASLRQAYPPSPLLSGQIAKNSAIPYWKETQFSRFLRSDM